jgi:hypothetical protein
MIASREVRRKTGFRPAVTVPLGRNALKLLGAICGGAEAPPFESALPQSSRKVAGAALGAGLSSEKL